MSGGREAPAALRRLQEEFGRATRTPLSFATGRMQCRTGSYPEAAASAVLPRGNQGPRERLAVYNEQYWFRLLTVLQDQYPLLSRVLGYWEFNQLATEYLQAHPSSGPFLEDLAREFPAFLRTSPRFSGGAYLQMAAADAAALRAFHAPAAAALDAGALARVAAEEPEDIPLDLQPWLTLLEEDWNLAETRRAILADPALIPNPVPGKGWWAVYRQEGSVRWLALDRAAFRLLSGLQAGAALEEACAAASAGLEGTAAEAFAANLPGWFAEWTGLGWFALPTAAGSPEALGCLGHGRLQV